MHSTGAPDDDTPQPSSPLAPNVISRSSNISTSKHTRSTNSGTHRPTGGPTLQGRPSYATIARNALSDERLDGAAGANPAVASGQSSRRRDPRPTDNPPATAISGATSGGHQAITERRDSSRLDIELDAQSRVAQPPVRADNTRSVAVHPTSSSKQSDISASKEARAAQRDGVANPGPILSASYTRQTSQLRPVTSSPSSRNEPPTDNNIPLRPPGPEETRERPRAELVERTTSVRPSVKPFTSPPQPFTPHERNAINPPAEQVERTASIQPFVKPSTPPPPPLKRPSASTSPPSSSPAPVLAKMASSRMHTPRSTLPYEHQVSSRGAPFETRPSGEDRGKGRPDELGRVQHGPPALSDHAPETTEPLQRGHKEPSATPHRSPAPLPPEHTATHQNRKDPSAVPHRLPVPPEHTSPSKEPPLQGHKDPSATLHRPPVPPDHTPTTMEPPRQEQSPSFALHRSPVPTEHASATTEPPRQGYKSPSATPHRPPAPPEHTSTTTEPRQEQRLSPVLHRPHVPSEHAFATTEPPLQGYKNTSITSHRPTPPERAASRQDRDDPSASPHRPTVPLDHTPTMTEPPRQSHRDPSATSHRLPAPSEQAASLQDRNDPSATPRRLPVPLEHTPSSKEPPRQGHRDPSATSYRPPAPPERTASRQYYKDPSAIRYGLPVPPEHTPATTEPWQGDRDPSATSHKPLASPEHTPAMTKLPSRQEHSPSSVPQRPPVPQESASAMTEPPLQGHKDPSTTTLRLPAPPGRTASRQNHNDPSVTPQRPPKPPDHTSAKTEPPQQSHRDPSAPSHRRPATPDHNKSSIVSHHL